MKKQRASLPPIHGARGIAFTTEAETETFVRILERKCSPVYENADVSSIGRVQRRVGEILMSEEDVDPLWPTSLEEVKAIIMAFRPSKAPGPDGITYRALKHAPRKFVRHMANICNAILHLRYFPPLYCDTSQWKQADVIMIPNPGQLANWPKNYRAISILLVMSKIAD
ncbi:hypothetical protein Trydic_g7786 [Trypoxylus dichotomus]